jgi:hypothetical protein
MPTFMFMFMFMLSAPIRRLRVWCWVYRRDYEGSSAAFR